MERNGSRTEDKIFEQKEEKGTKETGIIRPFWSHQGRSQRLAASARPTENTARTDEVGQVGQLRTCKKPYETGNSTKRVELGQVPRFHCFVSPEDVYDALPSEIGGWTPPLLSESTRESTYSDP